MHKPPLIGPVGYTAVRICQLVQERAPGWRMKMCRFFGFDRKEWQYLVLNTNWRLVSKPFSGFDSPESERERAREKEKFCK